MASAQLRQPGWAGVSAAPSRQTSRSSPPVPAAASATRAASAAEAAMAARAPDSPRICAWSATVLVV